MTQAAFDLFLESIVTRAVNRVLNTQFRLTAQPLVDRPAAPSGYASSLHSFISMSGARVAGEICLSLPDDLANILVAHMLGLPDTSTASEADKLDLAGEFCNMLAGQIGAALTLNGYLNDLGTPQVQRQRAADLAGVDRQSDFDGAWQCAGLPFTLSVSLRLASHESQDPQR
jgi:CheY-specific phosphatase CheX